jgi:hypothetical protein
MNEACLDPAVPVVITFLWTTTAVGFVFCCLYLTSGSGKERLKAIWKALTDRSPGS